MELSKDIAMEKEDQLKINQFSRLNMKLTELNEDKKKKLVSLIENLNCLHF